MAVLALAVGGAAIGSTMAGTLLGMTYATWGYMAGSAIGSMLFGEKTQLPGAQGPRLSDLKVQASTYGAPIPQVWGKVRCAGNMIWSADIVETEHTSTVSSGGGGKGGGGGGGSTQTQTTYSYSVSFAVGVCRGPIAGIRRIWANGSLIYNLGASADVSTVAASNKAAGGIRFYTGSETQMPDSLIEAAKGAGNVPAFRGLAYVVFDTLQLADFGNRIPNLEFEVITTGSSSWTSRATQSHYAEGSRYDGMSNVRTIFGIGRGQSYNNGYVQNGVVNVYKLGYSGGSVTGMYRDRCISGSALAKNELLGWQPTWSTLGAGNLVAPCFAKSNEAANVFHSASTSYKLKYVNFDRCMEVNLQTEASAETRAFTQWSDDCYIALAQGSTTSFRYFSLAGQVTEPVELLSVTAPSAYAMVASENYWWLLRYVGGAVRIDKYDRGTATVVSSWTGLSIGGAGDWSGMHVVDESRDLLLIDSAIDGKIWTVTAGVVAQVGTFTGGSSVGAHSGSAYGGQLLFRIQDGGGASDEYPTWYAEQLADSAVTIDDIVEDLCTQTGLAVGDLDTSQLTDAVEGYIMGRRMTARAALEPLLAAYYFDGTESDNVLKFVKRGAASVATISEDDLGAHVWGEQAPDSIQNVRAQELELPLEVAVSYLNPDFDYQVGQQRERRQTVNAKGSVSIELPVVMDDDHAKQLAETIMYAQWLARQRAAIYVSRKYTQLEPCDVITLPVGGQSLDYRIEKKDEGAPGVIRLECAREDASLYTSTHTGAAVTAPSGSVTLGGPTKAEFLDIPILRDSDDNAGFYLAACGYLAEWRGEQLFVSTDEGQTWAGVENGLSLSAAAMGACDTALGDCTRVGVIDLANTVTVTLTQGTLASCTRDQLFNGANVCAIGDEIVQFLTATLIGTSQYRLSDLLRARKGTDDKTAGHAIGDRFVLLSSGTTRRIRGASADINVERRYKPVSLGDTLQATEYTDFTNTCRGLKPLSVWHLGGGRNAALDVLLQWKRRTRLDATLRDSVNAPLGESAESYEIDIMNGSAVVRTLTSSTNSVTYTAAQQTTDFGSTQASLTVKVYQISATVGRGIAATATV